MKMRTIILLIVLCISACGCKLRLSSRKCSTQICREEAARILNSMDESVDPCDNFYLFACGKYIQNTKIPDDKGFANIFTTLVSQMEEKMDAAIKKPRHRLKPFRFLKKLYKQCLNVNAIESEGLTSLLNILDDVGNWPVLAGYCWKENNFEWKNTVYKLRKMGINLNVFLNIDVETDSQNSDRFVLAINQPTLAIQQEVLVNGLENDIVKAYYNYMVNVAVALGADRNIAWADLRDTLLCEIDIAKISLSQEEWWNATALYNPMTVRELEDRFPNIPWIEYITNVFNIRGIKIKPYDTVVVHVPAYLSEFEKLLERLPKRVQANYLIWRTIHRLIPYLTKDLRNMRYDFERIRYGNSAQSSRRQICLDELAEKMDIAMGALYVRAYFTEEARTNVKGMVIDLIIAFKNMVRKLTWTDEETRENALGKATTIIKYVGYSDEMLSDSKLEHYYKKLKLTFDNYLQTHLNLSAFVLHKNLMKLCVRVNKTDWTTRVSPQVINALYSPAENGIQVPAGILQSAFFNEHRPQYLNYGAVGFVIGHEITHGFDEFGRHYDRNGNLKDWWTEHTVKEFKAKAQCFVKQYNEFPIPEIDSNVDGGKTLNENIADNAGLRQAYLAYKNWKRWHRPELPLIGLNYNVDQLFWISAANIFCTKDRPEYLRLSKLVNPHAPLGVRILGSVSNSPEFAQDFNCPLGSKMNPVNKCQMW